MASKKFSNWAKNFGKSTKYATANIVESIAPNTVKGLADSRTAVNDFRKSIRNSRNTMGQFSVEMARTKLSQKAKKEINAGKRAFKSGNFAIKNSTRNKRKSSNYSIPGLDDLDAAMNIDFDSMDGGFDFSPNISIEMNNDALLEAMKVSSEVQSQVAVQSASYVADSVNNALVSGFVKLNEEMINTNRYLANIDTNIQNIIEFNNENIANTNMAMMDFMTDMKDYIQEIREAKEASKRSKETKDFYELNNRNGMNLFTNGLDIGEWVNYTKKNVKSTVGDFKTIFDMFGGVSGLGDMVKDMAGIKSSLVETIFTGIISNLLIPSGVKSSIGKFDKTLPGLFRSFLMDVGDGNRGGLLGSLFGSMFGIKSPRMGNVKLGDYYKDQLPWDGEAKKVLVDVIPNQLSQIIKLLDPNRVDRRWDSHSGTFIDMKDIENEWSKMVKDTLSDAAYRVQDALGDSLNRTIAGMEDDPKAREELQKNMNDAITKLFVNNIFSNTGGKHGTRKVNLKDGEDVASALSALGFDNSTIEKVVPFLGGLNANQLNAFNEAVIGTRVGFQEKNDAIAKGSGEYGKLSNLLINGESSIDIIKKTLDTVNLFDLENKQETKFIEAIQELGASEDQAKNAYEQAKNAADEVKGVVGEIRSWLNEMNPFHRFSEGVNVAVQDFESAATDFVYGGATASSSIGRSAKGFRLSL